MPQPRRCLLPLNQGVGAAEQRADPALRGFKGKRRTGPFPGYLCVPGPYRRTAPGDVEKLPFAVQTCGLTQLLQ